MMMLEGFNEKIELLRPELVLTEFRRLWITERLYIFLMANLVFVSSSGPFLYRCLISGYYTQTALE